MWLGGRQYMPPSARHSYDQPSSRAKIKSALGFQHEDGAGGSRERCMSPNPDRRRVNRSPVAVKAGCRTAGGVKAFVALVDLTAEGCCILSDGLSFTVGQRVILAPGELKDLAATVQWTGSGLTGLMFERPLYGPVEEHLARTFARPFDDHGTFPDELRSRLLREIRKAEVEAQAAVPEPQGIFKRVADSGPRPGLRTRRPDPRVLHLLK